MGRSLGSRLRGPSAVALLLGAGLVLGWLLIYFRAMHTEIDRLRMAVTDRGEWPGGAGRNADDNALSAGNADDNADADSADSEASETCGGQGLREVLDGTHVYQNGPSMIFVHDGFLNSSEVAHTIEAGSMAVAKVPWAKGRPDSGQYRSGSLDINHHRGDVQLGLMHERVARLVR